MWWKQQHNALFSPITPYFSPILNPGPKRQIFLARTQRNAHSRGTHVAFQEAADIWAHLPQEANGAMPQLLVRRGPGLPLRGSHRPQGTAGAEAPLAPVKRSGAPEKPRSPPTFQPERENSSRARRTRSLALLPSPAVWGETAHSRRGA